MKDYLWNHEGSDPEIEELERLLRPMRHKATVLPEIEHMTGERRSWRKYLPMVAVPAFAAVIVVAVWIQTGDTQIQTVSAPALNAEQNDHTVPGTEKPKAVIDQLEQSTKPVHKQSRRISGVRVENGRPAVKNRVSRKHDPSSQPELTREEREAYQQLIRALSITSSKLKLVKDKVEGTESDDRKSRKQL